MVQTTGAGHIKDIPKWRNSNVDIVERVKALLAELTTEEKLDQLNHRNKAISRLSIPAYVWWNEALHGLARSGSATVFPQAIGMAATFSSEMVQRMGKVIALEGRARHHESARKGDHGTYKGLTYWAPNVNIFRDPRWGRGQETYGEDPFLTGLLGSAFVKGVQGDDPHYLKAVATPKHFAVHSGPEATRFSFNSIADKRDLYETYLPAFKACIKAGAMSVMTAYNAYNGEPCSTNTFLIEKILREDWGFEGVIVTDAGAGEALYKEHKSVNDYPEAVAKELERSIDVIVDWEEGIHEAYKRGLLKMEDIDRAVHNQLMIKFRLGFFDKAEVVPFADTPYEVIECEKHRECAKQACRESLVLLKNENKLLPLKKESLKSIAVIGPNANNRDILLGNYHGTPTRYRTILEGFLNSIPNDCRVWYAKGSEYISVRTEFCAEDYDRISEAVSIAERSDVAILCLGLSPDIEGEAGDTFNSEAGGDRLKIELPEIQEHLLRKILETKTPVIVLMVCGSAIVSPLIQKKVLAMIHCWYPGAEGGDAIAEVVFGEVNPSGRLPVTFYNRTKDLPEFTCYDMNNRTYRFFDGEVAYPFGFGLSYTDFSFSDLKVEKNTGEVIMSVNVKNLGEVAGVEVVQVYVSLICEGFRTPKRQLMAVQRINLNVAEEKKVILTLNDDQFLITDNDGKQSLYSGEVLISVGASQNDEKSIVLSGKKPLEQKIRL